MPFTVYWANSPKRLDRTPSRIGTDRSNLPWNFPKPAIHAFVFPTAQTGGLYWQRGENEHLVKSACRTHSPLTAVCIMT